MVQPSAVGPILQQIEHLDDALAIALDRAALVALNAETAQRANAGALFDLLDRSRATLAMLRDRVVDAAVTEPTIDARIVALRARLGLTLRQLQELTRAAPEVTAPVWSGPYQSTTDVTAHVLEKISQAAAVLAEVVVVNASESVVRVEIDAALSAAEHTLEALGRDASLACFIVAAASVSSPRFRRASRMLAALLGVPLAPSLPPRPVSTKSPRRSSC